MKLTAELTNEQIVTNLLISNEILKPKKRHACMPKNMNLGEYLHKLPQSALYQEVSRYSFIDLENKWTF